jgi:NAD(P)H-dependent flavin oxidoreductase YrpB (nitropropane dioxygenase family)
VRTALCDVFGIDHPIFAFSHSREVVAAVSRAGGLGVFGALAYPVERLEEELAWVDEHVEGRPYGVDVVMPASSAGADLSGPDLAAQLDAMIPEGHRRYVEEVLDRHGVPALPAGVPRPRGLLGWTDQGARSQVEVALAHPIKLLVSALGPPPPDVVARCRERGIKVAALIGTPDQARKQVAAGVDVIVASGTEAGGHTGEISTLVLIPDVVDAVAPVPVLAAGGVGDGRQLAAVLGLGAQGAWTGSIWLTTAESNLSDVVRGKLLQAGSRDTVRSRALTGKPARQLRTPWTDAWDDPKGPGALPMPLQFMLTAEAQTRIGVSGNEPLAGSPVGQIVSRMDRVRPVSEVIDDLVGSAADAVERLNQQLSAAASRAGGS